jgi:NADPH:quinone reductase-like Zn-dependent oxidoreductase
VTHSHLQVSRLQVESFDPWARDPITIAWQEAGCQHVLIQDQNRQGSLVGEILALTGGQGVDVAFDGGGATFAESLDCLAVRGHLVSLGQASGPIGSRDIDQFVGKSLTISRPNFAHYNQDRQTRRGRVSRLFAALYSGGIATRIGGVFLMHAMANAHRSLESRGNIGSLILVPEQA